MNAEYNMQTSLSKPDRPDWLRRIHRISGLITLPFLLISIFLGMALSHTQWLEALSPKVYPSLPIPAVSLDEPVRPNSWDQLRKLIIQATGGGELMYIVQRDNGLLRAMGTPPLTEEQKQHFHHLQSQLKIIYWIDPNTMQIQRVEKSGMSLVDNGHSIHAFRIFGIEWLSIALITSVSLLVLLITGALIAWRNWKAFSEKSKLARWHIRIGQTLGVLTVIIVLTTLQMEFVFIKKDKTVSYPIPAIWLNQPLRSGSIDQAREVVEQAIGVKPKSVTVFADSGQMSFREIDGISGKWVWINSNTMQITRITDWRNDPWALSAILHDGRWLGGMNAFNINDAAALGLLFLTLSGVVLAWRGRAGVGKK